MGFIDFFNWALSDMNAELCVKVIALPVLVSSRIESNVSAIAGVTTVSVSIGPSGVSICMRPVWVIGDGVPVAVRVNSTVLVGRMLVRGRGVCDGIAALSRMRLGDLRSFSSLDVLSGELISKPGGPLYDGASDVAVERDVCLAWREDAWREDVERG